jgi:hypothetical protein
VGMLLRFEQFGGRLPIDDRRVTIDRADSHAQSADGMRFDGAPGLRPQLPYASVSGATIGKIPGNTGRTFGMTRVETVAPDLRTNTAFINFDDPDTDVFKGPNVNDKFKRHYFCSPSTGLQFATGDQIAAYANSAFGGAPPTFAPAVQFSGFKVGVPPPSTKITVTVDPDTGAREWIDTSADHYAGDLITDPSQRYATADDGVTLLTKFREDIIYSAYVMTYVNEFEEESMPGPPTNFQYAVDQAIKLTDLEIPDPSLWVDRAEITKKRIYRVVVSADGTGTFYPLQDILLDVDHYNDGSGNGDPASPDALLIGSDPLAATTWSMPPDGLEGIIAMPNGYFVGYIGKDLYFSEPYHPHAWPDLYRTTLLYDVVGLGLVGGTLVALTTGVPALIDGITPGDIQINQSGLPIPCVSRGSIVSSPMGVIFSSRNGLVMLSSAGLSMLTDQMIGRANWAQRFFPSTIRAALSEGIYYFTTTDVSKKPPPGLGYWPGGLVTFYALNPLRLDQGLITHSNATEALNFINIMKPYLSIDHSTGRVLGFSANLLPPYSQVTMLEMVPSDASGGWYAWLSREIQLDKPRNFGVMQVFYQDDFVPDDRYDPGVSDPPTHLGPIDARVAVTVLARLRNDQGTSMQVVFLGTTDVFDVSGREIRLPSGFLADTWQIQIVGNANLYRVLIGSTVADLRNA